MNILNGSSLSATTITAGSFFGSGAAAFIHTINSLVTGNRSVVLGGQNITGATDDTVYVPNLVINTGGTTSRLGINTSNPQYVLDVKGVNCGLTFDNSASSNALLQLSGASGLPMLNIVAGLAGGSIGLRAYDDLSFPGYGNQGDMFIYAGIVSNGLNLISTNGGLGSGADYIRMYAGRAADTGSPADFHIQGTGSTKGFIGFGTETPSVRLDVAGNGRFRVVGSAASAGALHYTSDGTLTTSTSDERLKTNITSLTGALDKVNQLRGVKYNWLESPSGDTRIGFIAQEVESIVPELTFTNKNSEERFMGVHYDNVTALLVEAIKELSSGLTTNTNTHLKTQTILAEDNNIDLNYNGTKESALGGGLTVLNAKGDGESSELTTDENGDWVTNNDFKAKSLTIPLYTPTSSNDSNGSEGNITRDEDYMYIKTTSGWKRTNLENF